MPSWLISLIPLFPNLLSSIATIWNQSSGSTLQKVATFLQTELGAGSTALTELEAWGAQQFPKIAPEFQAAATMLQAAMQHAGVIYWLQDGLNLAQSLGIIQFNGSGAAGATNTPLVVDGIYGPLTLAGVVALQTKFGLPATGLLTDAENNILTAIGTSGLGGAIGGLFDTLIADIKKL